MEDVGRRWKTWLEDVGSLAKSLGRRDSDFKKKKCFFSFFKFEIHVFQAILRGFPTSSSNVFQRLPTSSMCAATILGDGIPKNLYFCLAPPVPCLGEAQHLVGLVGRRCDPEVAEMSRLAETKPESDYPAVRLGKGTPGRLTVLAKLQCTCQMGTHNTRTWVQ